MSRSAVVVALAIAVLGVAGCSAPDASNQSGATAAESAPSFVVDQDFPDPDLLQVDDTYFAYATNSPAYNVQFATSDDLESWTVADSDALPELPSWAAEGRTWAPEVTKIAPGSYAMYFTASSVSPSAQCIGVATSATPEGPFISTDAAPLVCPEADGGAIDASTFVDDDGTRYLLWKNDGNCCNLDTWLQLAPLSTDGLSLVAAPTKLVMQTEEWEGNLVEAPTLVKHGDTYLLLYSANDYGGPSYAIGYATATSVAGPYTKAQGPFLSTSISGDTLLGPGGQDVVTAPDGTDRLVLHSWDPAFAYRGMNVIPLDWDGNEPVVSF